MFCNTRLFAVIEHADPPIGSDRRVPVARATSSSVGSSNSSSSSNWVSCCSAELTTGAETQIYIINNMTTNSCEQSHVTCAASHLFLDSLVSSDPSRRTCSKCRLDDWSRRTAPYPFRLRPQTARPSAGTSACTSRIIKHWEKHINELPH